MIIMLKSIFDTKTKKVDDDLIEGNFKMVASNFTELDKRISSLELENKKLKRELNTLKRNM